MPPVDIAALVTRFSTEGADRTVADAKRVAGATTEAAQASADLTATTKQAAPAIEKTAAASAKATTATRDSTAAAKQEVISRVAQILRNKEYVDGLVKQGYTLKGAREELRLLIAAERDEAAALTTASKAKTGAGAAAKSASGGVQSLIYTFNGLAARAVGLPQSVGTLVSALGPLAIGTGFTAAILAGVTAVGYGYQLLKGRSEEATKAINDSVEALDHLRRNAVSAPIKIEIDITNARKKLAELDRDIARARGQLGVPTGTTFTYGAAGVTPYLARRDLAGAQSGRTKIAEDVAFADRERRRLDQEQRLDQQAEFVARLSAARTLHPADAVVAREARQAATYYRDLAATMEKLNPEAQKYLGFARDLLAVDEAAAKRGAAAGTKAESAYASAVKASRGTGTNDLPPLIDSDDLFRRTTAGLLGSEFNPAVPGMEQNIKAGLGGIETYLKDRGNYVSLTEGLTTGLGDALAGGLKAGIAQGLATGNLKQGFAAMSSALSAGLGGAAADFAVKAITTSKLMEGIKRSLGAFAPLAALGAAVALLAFSNKMKGDAKASFGYGGSLGSYGGGSFAEAPIDRGVIAGAFSGSAPSIPPGGLAQPRTPIVHHWTVIGPNDPVAQQQIVALVNNASYNGHRLVAGAVAA